MLKNLFMIILLTPFFALAQAQKQRRIFFDVTGLLGYGSVKSASDAASPTIGSFTAGLAVGINIKKFAVGVGYDYRILTQHSAVDPTVGNRRGSFSSPLTLHVRLNFEKIKFGFVLINSDSYELMNTTSDGKKLTYKKPSGFRFTVNFKTIRKISPGLFYESVDFAERDLDGIAAPLTDKVSYGNYGLGVRYEF